MRKRLRMLLYDVMTTMVMVVMATMTATMMMMRLPGSHRKHLMISMRP